MIRAGGGLAAAALLATLIAGCPSPSADGPATATPAASTAATAPTPADSPRADASPSATPPDHVLLIVVEECTGLASAHACDDARTACARAVELLDAAKVPADDKWRAAVNGALSACR